MHHIKERSYLKKFGTFAVGILIGWLFFIFIFSFVTPGEWEVLPDFYSTLSVILSFVSMSIYLVVSEYHYLKNLEVTTTSLRSNISIYKEREYKLLSKAEEFIRKYLVHEGEIHKSVASSRGKQGVLPEIMEELLSLNDLKVTIESYPSLKADKHISTILNQLEESQNMILRSKLLYNEYITYYNSAIIGFPAILFSKKWQLKPLEFYVDHDFENNKNDELTYIGAVI